MISLRHHTGARYAIAGVALVILLGALAFSKRDTEAMDGRRDRDRARRPPWRRHRATDLVSARKNPYVTDRRPAARCS